MPPFSAPGSLARENYCPGAEMAVAVPASRPVHPQLEYRDGARCFRLVIRERERGYGRVDLGDDRLTFRRIKLVRDDAELESVPTWTCAFGSARRLCTQAGLTSAPPLPATISSLPSMRKVTSGTTRSSPDFQPVVVSSSTSWPSNCPPTLPALVRNSAVTLLLNALSVSGSGFSVTPNKSYLVALTSPIGVRGGAASSDHSARRPPPPSPPEVWNSGHPQSAAADACVLIRTSARDR